MKIDGRCHCGAIAFEAEVDPDAMTICHCGDCQMLSGSAFRTSIATASLRLLKGEPKSYVKTADSGARRRQAFCETCGTQIYACAESNPTTYSLRTGTIAQRAMFRPKHQIWIKSAMPWVNDIGSVTIRPD
jgi:hypothetical protein